MSDQDGTQATTLQRPTTEDQRAWIDYWVAQGQSWRTKPEIDAERQKYLEERRSITPDIKQGIYPFRDVPLKRDDVEWLLANHENRRGPVVWADVKQRNRKGLDLRGADLRGADLSDMPLSGLRGGLTQDEIFAAGLTTKHLQMAGIHLEGADLLGSHLERACLNHAFLEEANLTYSLLNRADLESAQLTGASLVEAQLIKAHLRWANLEGAWLGLANLKMANLDQSHLDGAKLNNVILTDKNGVGLDLVDVEWGNVNLSVVSWSQVKILRGEQTKQWNEAVRAYRQLSVVLRNQGLNEDAARFSYRAQLMQRKVYKSQRKTWQYLGSLFLDLLTGYGYKPMRSFLAYLIVILAFAIAYFTIGHTVGPALSPLGSVVFSMTSFHGRGFFPGGIKLDDPLTVVAALEAFIGLLIEVTFIATLTRRLFGG